MASQGKLSSSNPKRKDYSMVILERKKSPYHLMVVKATNDDNSIIALHPELLQLFYNTQVLSRFQRGPIGTRPTACLRSTAQPRPPRNPWSNLHLLNWISIRWITLSWWVGA